MKNNLEELSKEQLIAILNGASELQIELAHLAHTIAMEIRKVNSGQTEDLTILNGDDKLFERLVALIKLKLELSSLSLLPKSEEKVEHNANGVLKLKPGDNPYEHIVKQVKKNGNTKD